MEGSLESESSESNSSSEAEDRLSTGVGGGVFDASPKGFKVFREVVVVVVPEAVVVVPAVVDVIIAVVVVVVVEVDDDAAVEEAVDPGVGVVAVGGVAVPLPPPGAELPPVEESG